MSDVLFEIKCVVLGVESAPMNLKQVLCFSSEELTVSITLILTNCVYIYIK